MCSDFSLIIFFCKRERECNALSPSLIVSLKFPGIETVLKFLPPSHMHCPAAKDIGRSEVHPLLPHSSKEHRSSSGSTEKFRPTNNANLESLNKHPLLEKKKNCIPSGSQQEAGVFQLNDLQIKSMKTRMYLLNLFPIVPTCPHNFLPERSCYFCYQSNNLSRAFFLNIGGGAVQWSQSICFWFS